MSMPWGIADPYGEKATLRSALRVCAEATGVITGSRNHCGRMLSPGLGNRQIDCVQTAHLTEVPTTIDDSRGGSLFLDRHRRAGPDGAANHVLYVLGNAYDAMCVVPHEIGCYQMFGDNRRLAGWSANRLEDLSCELKKRLVGDYEYHV